MAALCACSLYVLKEHTETNMLLTTEQLLARNVEVHKLTWSTKACYNSIGLEVILSSRKYIPRKPSIKEFQAFSGYMTLDNTTEQKYFKAFVSLLATFGR